MITVAWSFNSERPIYLQICDHIRIDIISGRYSPGERLPSVRELAATAAVNPNTMQRAFAELESLGLVSSLRTTGRFVTEEVEVLARSKLSLASELTGDYIKKMRSLGYSAKEAAELLITMKEGKDENGNNSSVHPTV